MVPLGSKGWKPVLLTSTLHECIKSCSFETLYSTKYLSCLARRQQAGRPLPREKSIAKSISHKTLNKILHQVAFLFLDLFAAMNNIFWIRNIRLFHLGCVTPSNNILYIDDGVLLIEYWSGFESWKELFYKFPENVTLLEGKRAVSSCRVLHYSCNPD